MVPNVIQQHKTDRTHHQLHPESLLNHSDMVPAAALSNFFKAPAPPIHGKLPAIRCLPEDKKAATISIHQHNKCLAEVIQTQLLELKKLQDRYKYRTVAVATLKPPTRLNRHSIDGSLPGTKSSSSSINSNRGIRNKPRDDSSISSQRITPDARALLAPASTPIDKNNPVISSTAERKLTENNVLTSNTIDRTEIPPEIHITKESKNGISDGKSKLGKKIPEALIQNHMDPLKFATIQKWVQSVELAHKKEGKHLNVLSISS